MGNFNRVKVLWRDKPLCGGVGGGLETADCMRFAVHPLLIVNFHCYLCIGEGWGGAGLV